MSKWFVALVPCVAVLSLWACSEDDCRQSATCAPPASTVDGGGDGVVTESGTDGPVEFDPSSLVLSGYWRGPFAGGPWGGTKSLGPSGDRKLTNPPVPDGTPSQDPALLNGISAALFDGSSAFSAEGGSTGYYGATAWSGWALVKVRTFQTIPSQVTYYGARIVDVGPWLVDLTDKGSSVFYFADPYTHTPYSAFAFDAWQLVQWRSDASKIEIRANAGAWQSATPNPPTTNAAVLVGHDAVMSMMELALANTTFDDATFEAIRGYVNRRYALSL